MKRFILALSLLSLCAWGPVTLGGGGISTVGGGTEATINEVFGTGTGVDWDGFGSVGNGCVDSGSTEFEHDVDGWCHPDDNYTQPADFGEWAFGHFASTGIQNGGVALRMQSTAPTSSDFVYVIRCDSSKGNVMVVRSCEGAGGAAPSCTTVLPVSTVGCSSASNAIGFAVAGLGTSTELCVWYWASSLPAEATTIGPDDSAWGKADYCITGATNGDTTLLDPWADCPSATECIQWTSAPNFADVDKDVATYHGAASSQFFDGFAAGKLGL